MVFLFCFKFRLKLIAYIRSLRGPMPVYVRRPLFRCPPAAPPDPEQLCPELPVKWAVENCVLAALEGVAVSAFLGVPLPRWWIQLRWGPRLVRSHVDIDVFFKGNHYSHSGYLV